MQIERIEEVRLTAVDEAQIAKLLERAFPTEFVGRSYYRQRHHVRLVVRQPLVVGHMALTYRAIRVADNLIDIIGLAEVATDPDFRRQGIAGALLQAAIAEAKQSPAPFMLLFGDAPLYAAAGFRPVQHKLRSVAMYWSRTLRTQTKQSDGLMMLPLADQVWPDGVDIDMLGHLF